MRVFIPTKGRAATISTPACFYGQDYTVVVHTEAEAEAYRRNPNLEPQRIVVSGAKADHYGLTRQREFVCRELARPGEWFVFADDNINELTAVSASQYGAESLDVSLPVDDGRSAYWKQIYGMPCSPLRFMGIAAEMVKFTERVGAHLCGFALVDNPFFRAKKYRGVGYVIGKLMLWHNVPFEFDHTISMEDFRNTAEHLKQHGAVLINNFVFPKAIHYQPGGMGPYKERLPYRQRDVQLLLAQYPGLFRVKNRKGFAPNTDLQLRLTSPAQVQAWRAAL